MACTSEAKMVMCLKGLYAEVKLCVRVSNDRITDFFECRNGLGQGCLCSPMLFFFFKFFFINELAKGIPEKGRHGIQLLPDEVQLFLLLFADDAGSSTVRHTCQSSKLDQRFDNVCGVLYYESKYGKN